MDDAGYSKVIARICMAVQLSAAGATLLSTSLAVASTLIAVPDRVAHVYDPTRNVLYISTSSGQIQRYDVGSGALLAPFQAKGNLSGIDITPDGRWLYVTETLWGPMEGIVRKVDAETGATTNLLYDRYFDEAGSHDVAIGAMGLALLTTDYYGAGGVPIRNLSLLDDALTQRFDIGFLGTIAQRTHLTRSADRSTIFLQESGVSSGPLHVYDAISDSFIADATAGFVVEHSSAALNSDGSLIAMEWLGDEVAIFDRALNLLQTFDVPSGGLLFDSAGGRLFVADVDRNELVAYSTTTWLPLGAWSVGEDISDGPDWEHDGVMSTTDDGQLVFLSTSLGIRVIAVVAVELTGGGSPE